MPGSSATWASNRIEYDVWFPESTLHDSGAVNDIIQLLLDKGACYKAEDGAIMYKSAQYSSKYGVANKKKSDDGSEEEAKDEVLVRANGVPTYFAPTSPTTTTSWRCAALTRPSTCGAPTTTATWPA